MYKRKMKTTTATTDMLNEYDDSDDDYEIDKTSPLLISQLLSVSRDLSVVR